jgi:hypothetical protein
MTHLAQPGHCLGPAKGFFHTFGNALGDGVAGMARGAAVDRRSAAIGILGNMRGDHLLAQFHDKVAGVVALVITQRDRLQPVGMWRDQRQRRQALGVARSAGGYRTDNQAAAVLHQRVARKTQPRLFASPFAKETGVAVSCRGTRVVAAVLAMEVAFAVAPRARRFTRAVLRAKALRARSGLQQGAVEREMFTRQQALDFALRQHCRKELARHLAVQQPVAVLGETRSIPHRILDVEPDKPPEQQIGVDPLRESPLRTDRIERLQQQGMHRSLRRYRLAVDRRIELLELARQRFERGIGDLPNHPQRMIRPSSLLEVSVAEKAAGNLVVSAHRHPHSPRQGVTIAQIQQPFFRTLLETSL